MAEMLMPGEFMVPKGVGDQTDDSQLSHPLLCLPGDAMASRFCVLVESCGSAPQNPAWIQAKRLGDCFEMLATWNRLARGICHHDLAGEDLV